MGAFLINEKQSGAFIKKYFSEIGSEGFIDR
ncbi:MAG: hypothetical protein JWN83_1647 [Chitinophagaceae bacterium]|nr:hypothetical protein [Chitinophagaceae bacterium]